MRRARTQESEQALDAAPAERRAAVEPIESPLLQLQRTAGNKAVGSLLARDADKAETKEKATSATLVMPDPIGVIPLESYSMAGPDEIAVTAASSGADPLLFQAAADGTFFPVVKLSGGGLEITLTEVVISSVQITRGLVMFRLNAKKTDIGRPNDEPKGKPD